jgi:holo-[acyl-carrier protein] synthase
MVIGIGTDLVKVARIQQSEQRFGERFVARILTPNELAIYQAKRRDSYYLAKRFAAKEALVKALGTGIGKDANWQDIEVVNDQRGAPSLRLSGVAALTAERLGVKSTHLSLSDEEDHALAFVVLSGG